MESNAIVPRQRNRRADRQAEAAPAQQPVQTGYQPPVQQAYQPSVQQGVQQVYGAGHAGHHCGFFALGGEQLSAGGNHLPEGAGCYRRYTDSGCLCLVAGQQYFVAMRRGGLGLVAVAVLVMIIV